MQWPPSPGPGQNGMKPNGLVAAAVDRLPDVDAHPVAEDGDLVDEGDVDRAERVLEILASSADSG